MTTSIASFYYDTMMIVLWREIILFRNTNWKQKEILNSLTKSSLVYNSASEASFIYTYTKEFNWTKVHWKMPKYSIWRVLGKTVACGQTELPNRSIVN